MVTPPVSRAVGGLMKPQEVSLTGLWSACSNLNLPASINAKQSEYEVPVMFTKGNHVWQTCIYNSVLDEHWEKDNFTF